MAQKQHHPQGFGWESRLRDFYVRIGCCMKNKEKRWTEEEINTLKNMYLSYPLKKIKEIFYDRSISSIYGKCQRLKLKRNKKVIYETVRNGSLECLLEDKDESYYWIGLFFADGCIHNTEMIMSQSKKDSHHIKNFALYIGSTYREKKNMIIVSCSDCEIIPQIIKKFDIKKNKTYNPPDIEIFENMTDNQFIAFYIGFVDGDGNIKINHTVKSGKSVYIRFGNHESWFEIFCYMEQRLYEIFDIKFKKGSTVKIRKPSKNGFGKELIASWEMGDFEIIRKIKMKLLTLEIPYNKRKWDLIDETHLLDKEKRHKEIF